jgi:uncharacterized protein (DUF433 family)
VRLKRRNEPAADQMLLLTLYADQVQSSTAFLSVSEAVIMSGTPVFVGTRVPFETLIDYLEAGESLSEFLEDFPTVSNAQAIAALEQAKKPCWPVRVLLDECLPRRLK